MGIGYLKRSGCETNSPQIKSPALAGLKYLNCSIKLSVGFAASKINHNPFSLSLLMRAPLTPNLNLKRSRLTP